MVWRLPTKLRQVRLRRTFRVPSSKRSERDAQAEDEQDRRKVDRRDQPCSTSHCRADGNETYRKVERQSYRICPFHGGGATDFARIGKTQARQDERKSPPGRRALSFPVQLTWSQIALPSKAAIESGLVSATDRPVSLLPLKVMSVLCIRAPKRLTASFCESKST